MQTETRKTLIILMHGDWEVAVGMLAKAIGAKSVSPCDPATAQKHTGYLVGGISPFGTRTAMPIYAETTIFSLPEIYINGGKRGFLLCLSPDALTQVLNAQLVAPAIPLSQNSDSIGEERPIAAPVIRHSPPSLTPAASRKKSREKF